MVAFVSSVFVNPVCEDEDVTSEEVRDTLPVCLRAVFLLGGVLSSSEFARGLGSEVEGGLVEDDELF